MAGFSTAVTGLKASSTMLDVAGNNIANSSTVGFKSSRTEFGDIYTTSVVGAGSSNTPGSGVTVTDIAQDFSAGTLEFTNNNLDLAINGSGFFQLDDGQGGTTYTRAGAFELDKEGYVVSKNGKRLQGYGLDQTGNRLPIGDLAVTQKEYPPKATEKMELKFNIDDRLDAKSLLAQYDKDKAGSFSYSTTVRTFDSLGNEHTIKYNFVEQRPENQFEKFKIPSDPYNFKVSGVDFSFNSNGSESFESETTVANGGSTEIFVLKPTNYPNSTKTNLEYLQEKDPRIKALEVHKNGGNYELKVIRKADSRELGDILVQDVNGAELSMADNDAQGFESSNEKYYFEFKNSFPNLTPGDVLQLEVANENIPITIGQSAITAEQIAEKIIEKQSDIIEAKPEISSISWDPDQGPNGSLRIELRPDIDPSSFSGLDIGLKGASVGTVFEGNLTNNGVLKPKYQVEGDNSYKGVYHMYGYLNGEQALDLGKKEDPGEGLGTEPGPIVINFDPENGLLKTINGEGILPGGATPEIIIKKADPANEDKEIKLNIGGSTQFASDSIINRSIQDGYTKGDLVGVSFAPTGEMVAAFSNGEELNIGLVAVATFENQAGLVSSGDTEWTATLNSGAAIVNPPGAGLNGLIRSASLEQSNVDLSAELVKLIEAQRNYQANSKTLETLNTVTQSILQI